MPEDRLLRGIKRISFLQPGLESIFKKLFEKASLVHCESGEHAADLAEVDHGFGGIGTTLEVF